MSAIPEPAGAGASYTSELTDPRAMRALAHPLRIALLELLVRDGTVTATQAAEALGEAPNTCSFHLRQLAKYGFTEEAGGGTGRERPWRARSPGHRWSESSDDPETATAARALTKLAVERELEKLRRWLDERPAWPLAWQQAGLAMQAVVYVTPEELEDLGRRMIALVEPLFVRLDPALRPEGAQPVTVLGFTFPVAPTPAGN